MSSKEIQINLQLKNLPQNSLKCYLKKILNQGESVILSGWNLIDVLMAE